MPKRLATKDNLGTGASTAPRDAGDRPAAAADPRQAEAVERAAVGNEAQQQRPVEVRFEYGWPLSTTAARAVTIAMRGLGHFRGLKGQNDLGGTVLLDLSGAPFGGARGRLEEILRLMQSRAEQDLLRSVPQIKALVGHETSRSKDLLIFDTETFDDIIVEAYGKSFKAENVTLEENSTNHESYFEPPDLATQVTQSRENLTAAMATSLGRISRIASEMEELNRNLYESVGIARASGATWRDVGEALNVTPLSAQRRFDDEAKRKHAEYQRTRKAKAEGR